MPLPPATSAKPHEEPHKEPHEGPSAELCVQALDLLSGPHWIAFGLIAALLGSCKSFQTSPYPPAQARRVLCAPRCAALNIRTTGHWFFAPCGFPAKLRKDRSQACWSALCRCEACRLRSGSATMASLGQGGATRNTQHATRNTPYAIVPATQARLALGYPLNSVACVSKQSTGRRKSMLTSCPGACALSLRKSAPRHALCHTCLPAAPPTPC